MVEGGGEDEASVRARAVFISYASQDAAAAARICSALRQAGVEVWFDQSELRGGDVWDQRIRREIRDCTLFMPVISANTASRHEGYFRLEWDLADQRSHMMARDRAFIVPVCLDATKEAGTDVPESFHRVQWTRLPDGETSPAFTARIVALLGAPGAAASAAGSSHSATQTGHGPPPGSTPAATAKSTLRKNRLAIAVTAAITIILAYVAVDRLWLSKHTPAEKPVTAVASAPSPAIPEKSVAVLPFVDMSEKKDQEYFSDGLSEELIDMLTRVSDLRVPARTSSFYFKGKSEDIPTIAKRLMVAHVLEGSVRRSGTRLRITAQLVRADTGYHVWSETYDRELDDIFKIQDEIAAAVVAALKVTLLGSRTPRVTPTANTEAYTLYLQGQALSANAAQLSDLERAIKFAKQALDLDPRFARAWGLLARNRAYTWTYYTQGDYRQVLDEARHFAQRALELDPALPDAHLAMADVLFHQWEWGPAATEINQALALDPGNADAFGIAAEIALVQGRSDAAVELARKLVALDPLVAWNYGTLGNALLVSGQSAEAETAWRRAVDLAPTMSQLRFCFAWALLALHKPAAALDQMAQEVDERYRDVGLALAFDALGRKEEADRALAAAEAKYSRVVEYPIAAVYANRNDPDQAFKWLDLACELHDGWAWWVPWDPLLKSLRVDPRFDALLRKLGAVD
jgi:adenylate cyclase